MKQKVRSIYIFKDTKGGVNPVNEANQEDEDEDVPNLVAG